MATFLRDEKVLAADDHSGIPAAIPKSSRAKSIRVCFFIPKKIDPETSPCQQIPTDYQILKVRRAHEEWNWTYFFIHNIYNRPGSATLDVLWE
ncbi:hypothetical protein N7509_013980 [Penicillium cosmopolitanum]|uniref:Uncharacterized protein n=1 Tax=Penicillium cosmopolitanum TaxID=1131564 RepID=A0A9W9VDU6_9EURO|nr:uncharacterized protein N7509_013980 [Penicillium cosmopolitanum]KAJ5377094.1 hypothetical protein N7509_013980 [Penicillium cosmopolitanum]